MQQARKILCFSRRFLKRKKLTGWTVNKREYMYFSFLKRKNLACSRLSISGSERKQRWAKNQAIQGERADPLTEGLEQASKN